MENFCKKHNKVLLIPVLNEDTGFMDYRCVVCDLLKSE